ncbi:YihY/virulence factor BrkB family protein [Shivajiella indica]|uniref:YihY/virulence factor BrkB family protein n=1 Tax=Shivajiella indica TaxID=872115 RepID=A0ABW5B6N8_9BACT
MIQFIKKLTLFQILKDSIIDFSNGESMNLAAATAFYTIFSLPALLIIFLNIGTTFLSKSEIRDELLVQVEGLAGEESKATLEEILRNYSINPDGVIPNFIAYIILAFSATTVFISLQNAINHIWHIKPKPERGLLKFLINRFLSFSLVASIGFLLIVSLLLEAAMVIISQYLTEFIGNINLHLASILNFAITQLVLIVIFALMFKILPDAKVKWKDTWIGAIVTMILFGIGKFLIGVYLGNSDIGSTYGAAGSLALLLVWIYYSVVIFLFGGQVTYYIAEHVGGNIVPKPQAVKVEIREVD